MVVFSLADLPSDALECVLSASHDLATLRSCRATCKAISAASRGCLRAWLARSPSNLAELRCALWAEAPPAARSMTAESGLVSVTAVALDGDDLVSISGSSSQNLRLWSLARGNASSILLPSAGRSVALRDGHIATGLDNGRVHCSARADAAGGGLLTFVGMCPPAHGGHDVSALCWAAAGLLVSGGLDRALRVWRMDLQAAPPRRSSSSDRIGGRMCDGRGDCNEVSTGVGIGGGLGGGRGVVGNASDNGQRDGQRAPVEQCAEYLLAHRRPVTALHTMPPGCDASFASASPDGVVNVWSLGVDGAPALSASLNLGESVWSLAVDPVGYLACACASGLQFWHPARQRRFRRHIPASALTPNQQSAAGTSSSSSTSFSAAAAGGLTSTSLLASGGAGLLLSATQGRTVGQRELCIWDVREPRQPSRLARWTQMASVRCAVGGDGVLVCGGSDGRIHVWELPSPLRCRY